MPRTQPSPARLTRTLAWGAMAALLLLPAAAPVSAQGADPSPDDRAIYSMGVLQGKDLKTSLYFSDRELQLFLDGARDGHAGKADVDVRAEGAAIRSLQQGRKNRARDEEKKAGAAYAARMAKEEGARTLESGVVIRTLTSGLGENPKIVDKVKVHYHGTLRDGTVFDSSVDRGSPASFPLNRVIPCWTEGVQLMKVGEKAKLTCPAEVAYGDRGSGALIKPGATLSFEVELLGIE